METFFLPNSAEKYNCDFCNTKCCKKNDWVRHLSTDKHKRKCGTEINLTNLPNLPKKYICNCGKKYLTKS